MPKDEIDLIQQVQNGNLDSFTPLYETYFQRIYSFLLMKANWNVHFAEDATSMTFMKAFENIWNSSNKQIFKNVEKDLKNLWVSLKNYWEWVIKMEDSDENMWIVQVFYPFIINWKTVRYPEWNSQIWMYVSYDLNLQKVVSVVWIDIATYDVSNYPSLEKKVIEYWIEQGWDFFSQWALHENSTVVLFDTMEVVYIEKTLHEDAIRTIYVPAIKATVSTSIENYVGPSVVYQEII